jgi:hypothetical protein
VDEAAPALGRTCACNTGFEGDGETCSDIDACVNNACTDSDATCADEAAPALDDAAGRTCTCNTGFEGDGETCAVIEDKGLAWWAILLIVLATAGVPGGAALAMTAAKSAKDEEHKKNVAAGDADFQL